MKTIIAMSDTHGNQILLRNTLKIAPSYDTIFHLGDYYEDLDDNLDLIDNKDVIKVPGIYHPEYLNRKLPASKTVIINGWSFQLIHNIMDLDNQNLVSDFVLHGHTHHYEITPKENVIILNPGHLKRNYDRGRDASFMMIYVTEKKCRIELRKLDNKVFWTQEYDK